MWATNRLVPRVAHRAKSFPEATLTATEKSRSPNSGGLLQLSRGLMPTRTDFLPGKNSLTPSGEGLLYIVFEPFKIGIGFSSAWLSALNLASGSVALDAQTVIGVLSTGTGLASCSGTLLVFGDVYTFDGSGNGNVASNLTPQAANQDGGLSGVGRFLYLQCLLWVRSRRNAICRYPSGERPKADIRVDSANSTLLTVHKRTL